MSNKTVNMKLLCQNVNSSLSTAIGLYNSVSLFIFTSFSCNRLSFISNNETGFRVRKENAIIVHAEAGNFNTKGMYILTLNNCKTIIN